MGYELRALFGGFCRLGCGLSGDRVNAASPQVVTFISSREYYGGPCRSHFAKAWAVRVRRSGIKLSFVVTIRGGVSELNYLRVTNAVWAVAEYQTTSTDARGTRD
jgi:hypothetical protein